MQSLVTSVRWVHHIILHENCLYMEGQQNVGMVFKYVTGLPSKKVSKDLKNISKKRFERFEKRLVFLLLQK